MRIPPRSSPKGRPQEEKREDVSTFEKELEEQGWVIHPCEPDGNCMFRAVFGDEELHQDIREQVMTYMEKERDHFKEFITERFDTYIASRRMVGTYGNHPELQAICELYGRPVEVYEPPHGIVPLNVFLQKKGEMLPPLRLLRLHEIHYDAILDPLHPAVGLGVVESNAKVTSVESSLLARAERLSEVEVLDKQMLEQAMESSSHEQWKDEATSLEEELLHQALASSVREHMDAELEAIRESQKEYYLQLQRGAL